MSEQDRELQALHDLMGGLVEGQRQLWDEVRTLQQQESQAHFAAAVVGAGYFFGNGGLENAAGAALKVLYTGTLAAAATADVITSPTGGNYMRASGLLLALGRSDRVASTLALYALFRHGGSNVGYTYVTQIAAQMSRGFVAQTATRLDFTAVNSGTANAQIVRLTNNMDASSAVTVLSLGYGV